MYFHPKILTPISKSPVPALLRDRTVTRAVLGRKRAVQKLLVPIDGSPASLCAIEHIIARMDRNGTKVHLINVQQPVMSGDVTLLSAKLASDLRRDAGKRALQPAKAMLDANDFEYTAEVAFGSPAETIVDCASERHCTAPKS
jgi:nucleotide-binding universal stress UspA family protein